MGEIDFTNIIIDDFRKGKHNPFNKYIYILTHVHTDHLVGLSNSWHYGPIYCSRLTALLILNKFPQLSPLLKIRPLEQPFQIELAPGLEVTATFFDANHCAGAVMVLLEGYFGRYLYSGDFRFDKEKFKSYTYLYPPELSNEQFQKCTRPIDKLWLDNTFCNPRFTFPPHNEAVRFVEDFIRENLGKRIYIGMDHYGKEEALVHIAKVFDTIIVVDEQRYETILTMEFDREYFTTNPSEGLVEVVARKHLQQKMQADPNALGLVMSGWANSRVWKNVKGEKEQKRIHYVPYSLHSNYTEIVSFVRSIYPSIIEPVVPLDEKANESVSALASGMYSTEQNSQCFRSLVKSFTSPVSAAYARNLDDPDFMETIRDKLGLNRKTAELNKVQLGLNTVAMPARGRGYKLKQQRDEEEIERVKKEVKRKIMQGPKRDEIVISEDENDSSVVQILNHSSSVQEIQQPHQRSPLPAHQSGPLAAHLSGPLAAHQKQINPEEEDFNLIDSVEEVGQKPASSPMEVDSELSNQQYHHAEDKPPLPTAKKAMTDRKDVSEGTRALSTAERRVSRNGQRLEVIQRVMQCRVGGEPQAPGRAEGEPQAPGRAGGESQAPGRAGGESQAPSRAGGESEMPQGYLQNIKTLLSAISQAVALINELHQKQ